jgi:hypothetical protein
MSPMVSDGGRSVAVSAVSGQLGDEEAQRRQRRHIKLGRSIIDARATSSPEALDSLMRTAHTLALVALINLASH